MAQGIGTLGVGEGDVTHQIVKFVLRLISCAGFVDEHRVVKTLVRKDRLSDAEGWQAVWDVEREMRALFLEPIRWERVLVRDEMLPLGRADFLPSADDDAKKRVKAAVALFGQVPREIFTGQVLPRHTKRHTRRSEAELRLLREVPLTVVDEKEADEAELL